MNVNLTLALNLANKDVKLRKVQINYLENELKGIFSHKIFNYFYLIYLIKKFYKKISNI